MSVEKTGEPARSARRRMSHSDRHEQLLRTALRIVREERTDRLTLGYLAAEAGVSKPVAYDHFGTRADLLLELYRRIDTERVQAFRDAMVLQERSADETVDLLADAYVRCASDTTDEFHAVGAALAGNERKAAVFQELLDNNVALFVDALKPHTTLSAAELDRQCVGLIGAGEALATAVADGKIDEPAAILTLARIIRSSL